MSDHQQPDAIGYFHSADAPDGTKVSGVQFPPTGRDFKMEIERTSDTWSVEVDVGQRGYFGQGKTLEAAFTAMRFVYTTDDPQDEKGGADGQRS